MEITGKNRFPVSEYPQSCVFPSGRNSAVERRITFSNNSCFVPPDIVV